MNRSDFLDAMREIPVIDDHVHFDRYAETHGYTMPQFLYHTSYANVSSIYLPRELCAVIDDPAAGERLQFDALLQIAARLHTTRCGALLADISRRMGAPLEAGSFETLRANYAARTAASIQEQAPSVRGYICNSAGHPMYGDVAGFGEYLSDESTPADDRMFRVLTVNGLHGVHNKAAMEEIGRVAGVDILTLGDWARAVEFIIDGFVRKGIVGFKELYLYFRPNEIAKPDAAAAQRGFDSLMRGEDAAVALMDYLMYKTYEMIDATRLPVQVHTGSVIVSGESATKLMYLQQFITDFPRISFDLLHLNYPKLEDYFVLLRSCPNAYGNCTWVTSIDRDYTTEYVHRATDTLPPDHTIYLGTDRHCAGEPVAAVLEVSRQVLADALWEKVERRDLSADDALALARMWMFENPKRLFQLPV